MLYISFQPVKPQLSFSVNFLNHVSGPLRCLGGFQSTTEATMFQDSSSGNQLPIGSLTRSWRTPHHVITLILCPRAARLQQPYLAWSEHSSQNQRCLGWMWALAWPESHSTTAPDSSAGVLNIYYQIMCPDWWVNWLFILFSAGRFWQALVLHPWTPSHRWSSAWWQSAWGSPCCSCCWAACTSVPERRLSLHRTSRSTDLYIGIRWYRNGCRLIKTQGDFLK